MSSTLSATVCYGINLGDGENGFLGKLNEVINDFFDDEKEFFENNGLTVLLCGHGDGDYMGMILAANDSITMVEWSGAFEIGGLDVDVMERADKAMEEFCKKYEVPCATEWLVSALYY